MIQPESNTGDSSQRLEQGLRKLGVELEDHHIDSDGNRTLSASEKLEHGLRKLGLNLDTHHNESEQHKKVASSKRLQQGLRKLDFTRIPANPWGTFGDSREDSNSGKDSSEEESDSRRKSSEEDSERSNSASNGDLAVQDELFPMKNVQLDQPIHNNIVPVGENGKD